MAAICGPGLIVTDGLGMSRTVLEPTPFHSFVIPGIVLGGSSAAAYWFPRAWFGDDITRLAGRRSPPLWCSWAGSASRPPSFMTAAHCRSRSPHPRWRCWRLLCGGVNEFKRRVNLNAALPTHVPNMSRFCHNARRIHTFLAIPKPMLAVRTVRIGYWILGLERCDEIT